MKTPSFHSLLFIKFRMAGGLELLRCLFPNQSAQISFFYLCIYVIYLFYYYYFQVFFKFFSLNMCEAARDVSISIWGLVVLVRSLVFGYIKVWLLYLFNIRTYTLWARTKFTMPQTSFNLLQCLFHLRHKHTAFYPERVSVFNIYETPSSLF